jgi:hypothetical protein
MADKKTTALTATTTVADTDIVAIVADPGGSPVSKKVTKSDLLKVGTDIQAYSSALDNVSGVNTGDQDISGKQDILSEGAFVDGDKTKLDGIEASADVTDETNVVSALNGATLSTATVAGTDKVIIQDADDSDDIKTVTAQSIADLGGGGGATYAPSFTFSTDFSGPVARFSSVFESNGSLTFDNYGAKVGLDSSSGSGSYSQLQLDASPSTETLANTIEMSAGIYVHVNREDDESYIGVGDNPRGGWTSRDYFGFMLRGQSDSTSILYGVNCDGSGSYSETELLTGITSNNFLKVALKKESDTKITFYYSNNGSAWSAGTEVTSLVPNSGSSTLFTVFSKRYSTQSLGIMRYQAFNYKNY